MYLSNGDFGFPFTWPFFWAKQFYMWSFQTGAANPDGIIRMPGRLIDLLVFMGFGNLGFAYFYLMSSLLIAGVAFYLFATVFLEIRSRSICIAGALFFTCNPATLGNVSKIGLVLAAAMLPLCLVAVRTAFEKRQTRYLLLWLICLNISLIHPFTFAVNLAVSGAYGIYRAMRQLTFVRRNLLRLGLIAMLFVLLNMYFLLPLASMRSISKDTLSNTVTGTPTDYAALVDVLNTGDIFTGLSLSKNVVKDYAFYDATYANIYFLGAFLIYALLIGLYLAVERKLSTRERAGVFILLIAFLLLVLLAAVTFLHIDSLIRLLIQAPGGWAFRSPLKWQLYIPLTLAGLFVILAAHLKRQGIRFAASLTVAAALVLMDGFLVADIHAKLLTPRTVTTFGTLEHLPLGQHSLLFASGDQCWSFEATQPAIMNELNQVLQSQNVQVKRISTADLSTVNLDSYDYALDCDDGAATALTSGYAYRRTDSYANGNLVLYTNQHPHPYMYAAATLFNVPAGQDLGKASAFATQVLHQNFDTAPATQPHQHTAALQDVFGSLKPADIQQGALTATVARSSGDMQLYDSDGAPLYYRQTGNQLHLNPYPQAGYTLLPKSGFVRIPAAAAPLTMTYTDQHYSYANLIPNPSLEAGLWQQHVSDCYNYDPEPLINMRLDTKDHADGRRSVELDAGNHIACTGPDAIAVTAGQQYLLSFSYQSPTAQAGYSATFDDSAHTASSGTMDPRDKDWHSFSTIITAPPYARSVHLLVNAYPTSSGTGVARYDNFQLIAIPAIQHQLYVFSGPALQLVAPQSVHFVVNDPTKTSALITAAHGPFYLVLSDTYSNLWRLEAASAAQAWWPAPHMPAVPAASHLMLNGGINGWLVDPAQLCETAPASCSRNPDGSYNMALVAEFVPQRWFYLGLVISSVTFLAVGMYLIRNIRHEPSGERYYRWHR